MTPPVERCPSFQHSFRCACSGVVGTFATQRNVRFQAAVAVLVLLASAMLRLPVVEWAVLVLTMAAVFAAEVTNTAIEAVVDIASPGYSELARVAKDAAAGAVLIASGSSVLIGLLIFGPRLLRLL